jgi:hypothetical protein
MSITTATQTAYNVTFLADGECFADQTMTHPPQVGDRVCINSHEFIVQARMFEWSDDQVGGTGPTGVFVKMIPATDSWDG